ncbi:hypothetical protein QBC45DRAFT_180194 [Copromyces sp. CBS 386.78]|nr:hypothetical protein QBC45DRAFT_180194 [Copromyces sp. CBS 386.78]
MQRRVDTGPLTLLGEKNKEGLGWASIGRPPTTTTHDAETARRPIRGPDLIRSLGKTEKGLSVILMGCSTPGTQHGKQYSAFLWMCEAQAGTCCTYLPFTFQNGSSLTTHQPVRLSVYHRRASERSLLSLFGATHGFTGPAWKDNHPRPWHTQGPLVSRDARSGSRSVRGGYDLRNWACHFIASDSLWKSRQNPSFPLFILVSSFSF